MTHSFIPLDQFSFEPEIQIRIRINEETVAHYAACMQTKDDLLKFPPVIVFYDGNRYRLADGYHRRAAAMKAGHHRIHAEIRPGSLNDAIWEAIIANGKQGLSLTREDRKRAIEIAVLRWPEKSARAIAEAIGSSRSTMGRIRDQVYLRHQSEQTSTKVIGKDGKFYPSKVKKQKPAPVKNMQVPGIEPDDSIPDHNGYVPPPVINRPEKLVPHLTLQHIPADNPIRLIGCVFSLFPKKYILELIPGLCDRLHEDENGPADVRIVLDELNQKYS